MVTHNREATPSDGSIWQIEVFVAGLETISIHVFARPQLVAFKMHLHIGIATNIPQKPVCSMCQSLECHIRHSGR